MSNSRTQSATVLRLVPRPHEQRMPAVDLETIECLRQLFDRALRGEVNGLAFVAMQPDGRYFVDLAGAAQDGPTFARGMVAALDDELARRIHG